MCPGTGPLLLLLLMMMILFLFLLMSLAGSRSSARAHDKSALKTEPLPRHWGTSTFFYIRVSFARFPANVSQKHQFSDFFGPLISAKADILGSTLRAFVGARWRKIGGTRTAPKCCKLQSSFTSHAFSSKKCLPLSGSGNKRSFAPTGAGESSPWTCPQIMIIQQAVKPAPVLVAVLHIPVESGLI